MNNLLFILGIIALSNGNVILGDSGKNKATTIESDISSPDINGKGRGMKKDNRIKLKDKLRPKKNDEIIEEEIEEDLDLEIEDIREDSMKFNLNDISKGIKMLELSDDDLDRGMEIITRTKKYMNRDEKKFLIKIESILDLVRGIKKLSNVDGINDIDESDFFRSMESDEKKNMMIKEILEVFPDNKRDSVEKAIDMKKKIELFAELFLPEDIGEIGGSGFSLTSLASLSNLGSLGNLKLLGNLMRTDSSTKKNNSKYREYEEVEEDNTDYETEDYEILEDNDEDAYDISEEEYDSDDEYEYIRID